jgi:hypothetical protein
MGTNCATLLADLFLYSYEAEFIQGLLKKNETKLTRSFNFTFRYIDDSLSLNNSRFGDFVDRIYPVELEIKDTTDTDRSALYLDLHLEIDSEGRLRTKLYDKRDDFNFPIVNFPFICSQIPAVALAYGVYISQLEILDPPLDTAFAHKYGISKLFLLSTVLDWHAKSYDIWTRT